MAPPIKVGIVGLTGRSGVFEPGRWAVSAHLPPLVASPSYEIVALANSSVESARKSIAFHKLPPTTAAYGSGEDLAKDPNVDLVVVSIRAQSHFSPAKAAIEHGKDVFVEWPVGCSLAETEELARLAEQAGVKTAVGLQARSGKVVAAVKKILADGTIGKVVSSHALGNASLVPVDTWWAGMEYYLDMSSGANEFHIYFGHFLDSFIDILGDFDTLQSTLTTQWPTIPIVDKAGEVVNPAYPKTVPDHIMVQGRLASGAAASLSFRHTKASGDGTGIRWIIAGTEGEIAVTLPESLADISAQWQTSYPRAKVHVRVGRDEPVEVDLDAGFAAHDPAVLALEHTPLNTGLVYDAFAHGDKSRYADFASALRTRRLLERIAKAGGYA
ncbi:putative oxidoreductase [Lasiosphaeria ovina]|uniref:Oxidoreductase n=1 Tax=Lasiosphaeria ovina TaxID=92902 RepID=A0AAE0TX11_9PEZI|nr:putative oxidoreductase [Lasiosphaeria ovina]